VIAAFEAGKHVFCQKPLATNLKDCFHMSCAWQTSGKMFTIGFTLRYSPHYRKIKQLLEAETIGKIISLEFNETLDFNHGGYIMGDWRRLTQYAGSHLLEKCCHDIDLINWLVASKAKRVASFGGLNFFKPENEFHIQRIGKNKDGKAAYMTWNSLVGLNPFTSEKDIVDNQVVIIEFENGVRATFHTNCNAGIPERRMYILGTEGALRADVLTGKIEVRRIGFETKLEDHSTNAKGGHGDGDAYLVKELAASMIDGAPPSVGMDDALLSSITCFAIDDAMASGEVVDLASYWKQMKLVSEQFR
jgi:predicted dehydrogenase